MAVPLKPWGQSESLCESESVEGLLPDDLVHSLIRSSCASEKTKDDSLEEYGMQELQPESSATDCEVFYTVQLQRHASALRQLLALARSRISAPPTQQTLQRLPNAPTLPHRKNRQSLHPRVNPLGFLPPRHTPFTLGQGLAPEELNRDVSLQVLRKSICILAAQVGWDASSDEALCVLRDTVDDFFRRMTEMLRAAVDREAVEGSTGFPDSVEHVFHTMGIGSIRSLHTYYQRQVLGQRESMERLCHTLAAEYSELATNFNRDIPASPWETITVKQETVSEIDESGEFDQDVPELHFPSTSDGDLSLQPSASLRTGFEMLHSLERQQLLSEDDGAGNEADFETHMAEDDHVDVNEVVVATNSSNSSKRVKR